MNGIDTTGFSAQQIKWHRLNGPNTKTCKMCGAPVTRFVKKNNNYWDWCSNKCMGSDPQVLAKKRKTNKERHGDEAPQRLDWVKEKQAQTMIKNHGAANAFQSEEIMGRVREQWVEKYGVDNPSKNKEVIEVIRQKALERDWETVLNKRRETNYRLFGSSNNSNAHLTPEVLAKLSDYDWFYTEYVEKRNTTSAISKALSCSTVIVSKYRDMHGFNFTHTGSSQVERDLFLYVASIVEAVQGDRTIIPPKELDIAIPEYKIAIEVNGMHWHSEYVDAAPTYHQAKSIAAAEKGYALYHITDREAELYTDNIKDLLSKLVGYCNEKSSNELEVLAVSCEIASEFYCQNYYTDHENRAKYFGLYDNDQLLAVIAYDSNVLDQYCDVKGTKVTNGNHKFASFLHQNGVDEVNYLVNRNYPIQELLTSSKFVLYNELPPAPTYFNRMNCSELVNIVDYPEVLKHKDDKARWDAAVAAGLNRIWNAGFNLYTWNKNEH